MKQTYLLVNSAYVNVCDETVGVTGFVVWMGVTQDLWWDYGCDTGFVMRLWVWHRICDVTVGVTGFVVWLGVTQDLWWDCGCDTGFVMRLWVWHRICDVTVGVTQDLWWECGCETGFVMWMRVWHRICEESDWSFVNWDSVVVKALRYESGCPGIDSRWCHWGFFHGFLRNHVPWDRLSLRK